MFQRRENTAEIVTVFQTYQQKMYHIAYAILHDEYQAEDAVMNAFVRLLEKNYRMDDAASDKTKRLIITVTRNAAIDLYRKNQREREKQSLSEAPEEECRNSEVWELYDFGDEAESMIVTLPTIYREVLTERFIKDRSIAETAKSLGVSEATIRKRQERALRILREQSGKKGVACDVI